MAALWYRHAHGACRWEDTGAPTRKKSAHRRPRAAAIAAATTTPPRPAWVCFGPIRLPYPRPPGRARRFLEQLLLSCRIPVKEAPDGDFAHSICSRALWQYLDALPSVFCVGAKKVSASPAPSGSSLLKACACTMTA